MGNKKRLLTFRTSFACFLFFLFLLSAGCSPAAAAVPATLRVRQAFLEYPSLTVYADLWDEAGKMADPGPAGKITATVGNQPVQVGAWSPFSSQEEGITSVFLVDISGSIKAKRFDELKKTIAAMIEKMKPLDRAALISFGEKVTVEQDFTSEKKSLLYSLQNLQAKDKRTQLNQGLLRGLELARMKREDLPRRRIIILCSDGIDDMPGGATTDEVREALTLDPVPVYSIFFDADSMSKASRDAAFKAIGEFSRRSGGQVFDAKSSAFSDVFNSISASLNESLVLKIDLGEMKPDGTAKRIEIAYTDGEKSLYDGISVRLTPKGGQDAESAPKEPLSADVAGAGGEPAENWLQQWKYPLAAGAAVFLGGLLFFIIQKKKKQALVKDQEVKPQEKATVQMPRVSPTVSVPVVPTMKIELIVTGTTAPGEKFTAKVSDRLVLGRNAGQAVLTIPGDGTISGRHCELVFSRGKLFVADLQSTNGTMVNGVPVRGEFPLNDGDRLTLGKTEMRVRIIGIE